MKKKIPVKQAVIFDVMYGFIPITEWEAKIINSPFFQRLRWIKQLGFSNYIFPGAEHNRFAHVIGVMHSMDQMIHALGLNVSKDELFNPKSRSKEALLHKSLRIAALLHDIGTFPFSHAIEYAYMRQGNVREGRRTKSGDLKSAKSLSNNHEHLGAFIIKNTRYEGGLTSILEDYGLDVQMISKIIKGESPHFIANQLMHSDLDADRMDYLLRDAHYTGIKYGQFDRDYLLANLTTYQASQGQIGFGIRENAAHALEDFLIARFSWYSQVIKNQASAKFDIMASHIAKGLLEEDLMLQFHDLLTMIDERDERFFFWNDLYFMNRCQEVYFNKLCKDPKTFELIQMLLYRKAPKSIHHPAFSHQILNDGTNEKSIALDKIHRFVKRAETTLQKHGTGKEWLLLDIPTKDVLFTKGTLRLGSKGLSNYEPAKVVHKNGKASLLIHKSNSLMKHLSGFMNFVPNMYTNESGLALLKKKKIL